MHKSGIALATGLLLTCAAQAQTTFNVGLDVEPGTMDPRLMRDTSATRMQELIFNGLIRLDPNLKPVPALATSWRYTTPTSLEVNLRKNVLFHDGSPFTADDVVYTFNTVLDTKFNSPRRSFYTPITKIEAINPYKVRFTLDKPFAPLIPYLDMGIVSKAAATKMGADYGNAPVGTGPFKFASWQRGNRIELVANDKYWGGKPKVDRIVIRAIPDNNVRLVALESGELDYIHSPIPPQELDRLAKNPKLTVQKTTGLGITYLNLNTKDPVLSDRRVRQALAYLTDRQTISQDLYYGMDTPGDSFLLPGTSWYSPAVKKYPYDPQAADKLLTQAGWVAKAGGIRTKNGKPLQLEIVTNVDPNRQQVLDFLQGEWRKAGIDVKVRAYDFASMLNDLTNGKFQISLVGWLNLTDPDRASYNQFTTNGSSNYGKYSNPKVDALLEKARSATNVTQRKVLYSQAAKIVTEDVPYIFVLNQGYVAIFNKRVTGYQLYPSGSWYSFEDVSLK
ncbi:ABC transporter substrate-binding protein (plasmid) [Deinococcus metallilatus]|uniref:ABC transporter substrate-binding protein n=1 Tax=Deinococcus metallilatus TaxID=1211322 RepID=A0AAJ5F628_9DEIO|nr:ABC transporter substrate-binding protein [Deinococcus metallilatus]MBB5295719.1 peptide/nickel transport system substrate-binding protein [Deinococcus metallilatus]QBY06833.1 ABC transporter substrate-binding protein [Deinococcus metallilatus]TLK32222.1 ABC transporter substrate-binding protein [Deinococcus metallilatus]GMA14250.1 peptide ABC transporter substrate-binding protein [Deinococcus metallilatus]